MTEIKGKWWLPNKDNIKISGTLNITDDSIYLLLDESLPIESSLEEIDIILGEDDNKRDITLYKTKVIDILNRRIWISYVIYDALLINKDEVKFTEFTFRCKNITEWLREDVIEIKNYNEEKLDISVSKYEYVYQLKEMILTIKFVPGFIKNGISKLSIKQNPEFILEFKKQIHLNDIINLIYYIQDFFIILTNRKIQPYGFRGKIEGKEIESSISFQEAKEPLIEHYFGEEIPFSEIKNDLDVYLSNWLEKKDKIKNTSDLFLGLIYIETYAQFKLLAYTQAIESYHRNFIGGEFISIEDYKPIQKILTDSIPSNLDKNHKNSLKSRIKYGYQYSLRKRFKEILGNYWDDYFSVFLDDKDLFENQVIYTRNYLTHYCEDDGKEFILKDEKLVLLNLKLKLLCQILLLIEIGIPKKLIWNFLINSGNIVQIKYLDRKDK